MSWVSRLIYGLLPVATLASAAAQVPEPFTFGMAISQTGALAPGAKAALLGMQIWVDDTNAHGGLLGRQVKLVTYDDQSNPALVPSIVAKLLDVDKVDFLLGGQGTNLIAPLMPTAMQHNLTVIGMFGLDVNSEFHYENYFSIIPAGGAHPKEAFAEPFFEAAAAIEPTPRTIALVGADAAPAPRRDRPGSKSSMTNITHHRPRILPRLSAQFRRPRRIWCLSDLTQPTQSA
jgi:branched-chain amino acid transport system substrate-binding protein